MTAPTWISLLRKKYGSCRIEDVFQGTQMQDKAKALGFGLYVVRNFITEEKAHKLMEGLTAEIKRISFQAGCRSVQIKGNKLWYESLQVLLGNCICTYMYAGTARNKTFREDEIPMMEELNQWMHTEHGCDAANGFHQIVANIYNHERNENTPWHTDANILLKESTEVLCISLGAPGIYCVQPNRAHLDPRWGIREANSTRGDKLRKACIELGLRACVPVLPGDLIVSTGTFMQHCEHKTMKYKDLTDGTIEKTQEILHRYPATNMASRILLEQPHNWISTTLTDLLETKPNRGVITFRRTDNHWRHPRCPEVPAAATWNNVHADISAADFQNPGQRHQPILLNLEQSDIEEPTTVHVPPHEERTTVQQNIGATRSTQETTPGTTPETPTHEMEANTDDLHGRIAPTAISLGPHMSQQSFNTSRLVVADCQAFLQFLSTTTETLCSKLSTQTPLQQTEILQQIERLANSAQQARRTLAIGEIAVEAYQVMDKLKATVQPLPCPLSSEHHTWIRGTNKKDQMRILVSVGTVMQIFRHADYDAYINTQGIVADLHHISNTTAYHLKGGQCFQLDLNNVFPGTVAMRSIEMRLDYERVMERLNFQPIALPKIQTTEESLSTNDKKRRRAMHEQQVVQDCSTWSECLLKEKRRQMNIEDLTIWPKLMWNAEDVMSMPVVIWIKMKKEK
jgi:hypothetical protein